MSDALLELRDLVVAYDVGRGRPPLRAVDGVNLTIAPGETVGLVGESGSGKTTIGRATLGLTPVTDGSVIFAGEDITHAPRGVRRRLSAQLQVVFQDPYSSLNPTRTLGQTLGETIRVHRDVSKKLVRAHVKEALERVGLPGAAADRYPSQFSGGQRQRVAIARALIAKPRLVICDEPVSSLDLSVQAQVLNLLQELQRDLDLAYLFISHDLDVVRQMARRIVVLYLGRIMEEGDAGDVYRRPRHPYTHALLAAAPVPDPQLQRERRAARMVVTGAAGASVSVAAEACPFAPRCPHAIDRCRTERPQLETTISTMAACHRWRELGDGAAIHAHSATGS